MGESSWITGESDYMCVTDVLNVETDWTLCCKKCAECCKKKKEATRIGTKQREDTALLQQTSFAAGDRGRNVTIR